MGCWFVPGLISWWAWRVTILGDVHPNPEIGDQHHIWGGREPKHCGQTRGMKHVMNKGTGCGSSDMKYNHTGTPRLVSFYAWCYRMVTDRNDKNIYGYTKKYSPESRRLRSMRAVENSFTSLNCHWVFSVGGRSTPLLVGRVTEPEWPTWSPTRV